MSKGDKTAQQFNNTKQQVFLSSSFVGTHSDRTESLLTVRGLQCSCARPCGTDAGARCSGGERDHPHAPAAGLSSAGSTSHSGGGGGLVSTHRAEVFESGAFGDLVRLLGAVRSLELHVEGVGEHLLGGPDRRRAEQHGQQQSGQRGAAAEPAHLLHGAARGRPATRGPD